jgi:hypothetical protein
MKEIDENIDRLVDELADLLIEKGVTYYMAFSEGGGLQSSTNIAKGYHSQFLLDVTKSVAMQEIDNGKSGE